MQPDQLDAICEHLASGGSVREACERTGVHHSTFYRAVNRDDEIATRIARAREAQQEYEADQCVELADKATIEDWQVVKLRIWARQWRAAKLAPKKYGDKVQNIVTGQDGGPIKTEGKLDVSGLSKAQIEALASIKVTTED